MSPRTFALSLCIVPALASAHAQTAVYAIGGVSGWQYDSNHDGNYSSRPRTGNVGGGAFYNFPIQSRVTVGVDGRALVGPGTNGGYLAGASLRVAFVPHHNPLSPFVQIGGGVVHTTYPYYVYSGGFNQTLTIVRKPLTNGALQLNFGLDIRLTDHLDLRAPDWGALAGPSAGTGFFDFGLVYHLHPRA